MDPFTERWRHHAAGCDDINSHLADEIRHDFHVVIQLCRHTANWLLFLGLLCRALNVLLCTVLLHGNVSHGVSHRREDGGAVRFVKGTGWRKAGRCVAQVCASLRVHRRHRNGELVVAVCKVVAIILRSNARLTGVGGLLIRHAATARVVAGHKLGWGQRQLSRHVLPGVEGRHDGGRCSCRRTKILADPATRLALSRRQRPEVGRTYSFFDSRPLRLSVRSAKGLADGLIRFAHAQRK